MVNAILRRFELMSLSNSELPSGYKRLEFIYNPNYASIDTGIQPNYTFEYELKANAVTGNIVAGTLYINGDNADYRFFQTNSQFYFDVGGSRINGIDTSKTKWTYPYHVKWGNYYIEELNIGEKITGTTFDENMNGAIISSNIYLLGGYGQVSGKVWLFKIWDNGTLVRDFIPARRLSDNKVGMYDKVGKNFYISARDSEGYRFKGSDEVNTTEYIDEEETTNDELIDGYTVLPDGTTYHKTTE